VIKEGAEVIGIGSLSKANSDRGRLVSNKVLEGTSGHVMVEKGAEVVSIRSLSEANGDGGRLIGNEVLQGSSGHVVIEQGGQVVGIGSLGKTNGDRARLISNEVLESTSSDVVVEESAEVISIGSLGVKHDKRLSDGGIRVSDKVDEGLLSDVLSVELSDEGGGISSFNTPVGGLGIKAGISVVIRESLIEGLSEALLSIVWVLGGSSGGDLRDSLDHHGDSDVVVVSGVLLLISVLLEDGVEGVVADDLSERLEGH